MLTVACSELAREKMWSRIHLIPLLQAEEDRDVVRRHYAQQKMEEELLGKAAPVYYGDRYVKTLSSMHMWKDNKLTPSKYRFVRPTYAVTPANVTK
jgi:hypothetical protein